MKNIKTEFSDYSEIINKIGEEKIEERFCAIHDIYLNFIKSIGFKDEIDIIINDRILMHCIMDYFADITRLKNFHKIELINKDKIISYECSWFLRRKPIQLLRKDKEEMVYVNEKFVLTILVNHLTLGKIDSISEKTLMNSFCESLLYYLKFRDCSPKIIEMIILSFKAGNSLNPIEEYQKEKSVQ